MTTEAQKAAFRRYYHKNKDKWKAYQQSPQYKAYQKAYQQSPQRKASQKAYQQSPQFKAYQKKYYLKNREKILAKMRKK